jgi:hypothetical protein
MKMAVFLAVALYSLVDTDQRFRVASCLSLFEETRLLLNRSKMGKM